MSTFMAYAGGIPTFITLGFFIFSVLYLNKKKVLNYSKLKQAKRHAKLANTFYYRIKELLPQTKPLVRFRFWLLVGSKRFKNYMYQG